MKKNNPHNKKADLSARSAFVFLSADFDDTDNIFNFGNVFNKTSVSL